MAKTPAWNESAKNSKNTGKIEVFLEKQARKRDGTAIA